MGPPVGVTQMPAPQPETQLDEEFWAHCAKERLCFQRCTRCATWRHLPRTLCAQCGSPEWEWRESSGRGHLYSWTVTHQAILPQFAAEVPYVVAVVELEEGPRMVSRLRDVDAQALRLDLPLQVTFERINVDMALPFFRPANPERKGP
jgi:uncharacterized OB-fold protein